MSVTEMVPIEHEARERVVRTLVFGAAAGRARSRRDGWRGAEASTGRTCSCSRSPTRSPGWGSPSASTACSPTAASRRPARVRALLAVLGSMAVEGPVIEWVATHRKHHRFSDHPGDPHSPHVDHAPGWRGALRGLGHAHVGWMFRGKDMANPARYAKDLLADRDLRFISRTFPLWVRGRAGRCRSGSASR